MLFFLRRFQKHFSLRVTKTRNHLSKLSIYMYFPVSHNNPCFQCNIAITNFFDSHTCEIRFRDVIGQSTIYMYFFPTQKFKNMVDVHGIPSMFFNLNGWIQLCGKKKNLSFVDCCDGFNYAEKKESVIR